MLRPLILGCLSPFSWLSLLLSRSIPCHLPRSLCNYFILFSPSILHPTVFQPYRIRRGVVVCVPRIAHQPRSLVMSLLPRQRITRGSHPEPHGGPAAVDSIAAGNDGCLPPPSPTYPGHQNSCDFFQIFHFFFSSILSFSFYFFQRGSGYTPAVSAPLANLNRLDSL